MICDNIQEKKTTFSLSNQTGISAVSALSVTYSWESEHLEPSKNLLKLGPGHPRKVCEENSSWTKVTQQQWSLSSTPG